MGLVYKYDPNQIIVISAYSDSNQARDIGDRKSTSGQIILLNDTTIYQRSNKQHVVVLSSIEAEYIAAFETTREIIWIRMLLDQLGYTLNEATTLYIDNDGAKNISNSGQRSGRLKHIDIKHHYINEAIEKREIGIIRCNSEDNVADTFTKALPYPKFIKMREKIGVWNI